MKSFGYINDESYMPDKYIESSEESVKVRREIDARSV